MINKYLIKNKHKNSWYVHKLNKFLILILFVVCVEKAQ